MNKESNARKGTRARTRRARKAKQPPPQPPPDLLYSNQGRDGDNYPSMAMMKEKQRETIDKKMRGNYDNLGGLTNEPPHCFYDGTMRGGMLDCDERKDDPLGLSDDLMNKSCVGSSNMSCSLADHKSYLTSDMCSLDNKLDDPFLEGGLPSSCKSNKGDLLDDSDFPHDLMLDNSMSTCKPHKTEDIIAADPEFPPDTCESMLPAIGMPMGLTSSESMIDNIQPLPSNIINKQPTTMEAQYMQQQSQVFVFSTALANKSAESVMQGHYPSIIAYHCAQPKTKQYLEKHPLKSSQFNRQNSNPWLNSFVHAKQKSVPGSRRGGGRGAYRNNAPPYMMPDNNMMNSMQDQNMAMNSRFPMWNQPNMNPMNGGGSHGHMMSPLYHGNMPSPGMGHMSTRAPPPPPPTPHLGGNQAGIHPMKPSQMDMMCDNSNSNPMMSNNMMSSLADFPDDNMHNMSPHNPLQGVKIPDENLTPQQRQHREVKLATLQQIGQMLLPESNQPPSDQVQELQQTSADVEDLVSSLTGDSGDIGNLQRPLSTSGTNAEWQKIQYELFDDRKKKSEVQAGMRGNSRSQGPPPPYHQTTRSASVPIAISSPNPTSPGTNTSNLSLPSPRTCSSLNSPASRQRPVPSPTTQITSSVESPGQAHNRSMNLSNPSTPLSSSTHLSPKQKDPKHVNNEFSPATSGQHSPDGIFCRSLQTLAQQQQQKQQHPNMPSMQAVQHLQQQQSPHLLQSSVNCREPNLMPVPSPQHIQYLNTFEGQELTIQKQPNTSLKDTSGIMSPSLPNSGLDSMLPSVSAADMACSKVSASGPSTPSSVDLGNTSRYPAMEFAVPSPSTDGRPMSQMRGNGGSMKPDVGFNCSSPQISDQQRYHNVPPGFMGQPGKPGMNFMDIASPDKMACNMPPGDHKDISCNNNYGRMGVDNVPLNPSMNPVTKHQFDPLSSLTQMSQQLSSSIPGSPVSQPPGMMHSGMVPFNNMHMMQMNDMSNMCPNDGQMPYPPPMNMQMANDMSNRMIPCSNSNSLSPKPPMMQSPYPMQRIMSRTPGPMTNSYNGPNIQVKPSAPNTIQYLPSRPQTATSGPRAPPSLDFLTTRYSSPMGNMDNKMPPSHPHNMNYYPGNYPGPSGVMNDMMGQMNCSMPPGNQMMRGPMRPPNNGNMIRMPGGVVGMGYNPEQMYGPGPGPNPNCPMYGPGGGPKVQSMGVAPDATQPLPPSIGQSNNFKNSPFIGPTTADPNYAQQFHNFQQQLYATNTRTQMGNQSMSAPNQQYFVPK